MEISHAREKELVFVQIFYLYIIPIVLLYFGIIPGELRVVMLLCITLLLLGIVRHAKWTFADMGITHDFMKDALPYTLFTIAGVGFIVWLAQVVPQFPPMEWWENLQFLLLFIPISVFQEIIFRGVLMNLLRRTFSNPFFIIILNAAIFSFIHVIYLNSLFIIPFTFIAGLGFAWIYYQYPNLILISISHTILNFTAMTLGFFVSR